MYLNNYVQKYIKI